jgi:hypothetical protein
MYAGNVVIGHAIWQVIKSIAGYVPHSVSVIGPSESGKTTLDLQLTTKGEIRNFGSKERTHHRKGWLGRYKLPDASRKKVRSEGVQKTIVSRDLGGHVDYHHLWMRDMIERKVRNVVVIIDNRHLMDPRNLDNQTAMGFLVETLSKRYRIRGLSWRARLRSRKYAPERILLLANKADDWMSDADHNMWEKGFIARHQIFDVFRNHLYDLQAMHIPVYTDAISAKYGWNVNEAIIKGLDV